MKESIANRSVLAYGFTFDELYDCTLPRKQANRFHWLSVEVEHTGDVDDEQHTGTYLVTHRNSSSSMNTTVGVYARHANTSLLEQVCALIEPVIATPFTADISVLRGYNKARRATLEKRFNFGQIAGIIHQYQQQGLLLSNPRFSLVRVPEHERLYLKHVLPGTVDERARAYSFMV